MAFENQQPNQPYNKATVFALDFSPDGDLLVSSDALGRCKVWAAQLHHDQCLAGVEEAHDLGVNSLCFSPKHKKTALLSEYLLVTCGNDGFVALWKILAGPGLQQLLNES